MRLPLCLALLAASWPAGAVGRLAEVRVAPSVVPLSSQRGVIEIKTAAVPAGATPETLTLPAALPPEPEIVEAGPPVPVAAPETSVASPSAAPQVSDAAPDAAVAPDPIAGWVDSQRRFDHASRAPPAAVVLGAAVPAVALAAAPAAHAFHALLPHLNAATYDAANILSVAFPMPEVYGAFRRGSAQKFPLARAAIGAAGTLALGLINATVLGKPLWGVMHAFIALGMMAPYFIGKAREKRGELARGKALIATAGVGLLMLAASAGLYAAAAAFLPALLAAHLSASAAANLLLGVQIAKGALFVGLFAPDIAALLRGKPTHGFSKAFTSIYLASVAAFTAWGFLEAAASPAGAIRSQYLIHGARNLTETIASALSLLAIHRASAKGPDPALGPGPMNRRP